MLKNYLKIALRSLVKNKLASIINLTGLSTAIGCGLVAFAFFDFHYNRDVFHENAERIFLAKNLVTSDKGEEIWGDAPLPLGPALARDFSQVKRAVRLSFGGVTVSQGDRAFQERVQFTEKDFLQVFSFPMKFGERAALSDRNAVILGDKLAVKYFGESNPVGNELNITMSNGRKSVFIVRGVTEQLPENSSIAFSMLLPFEVRPDLKPHDHQDWALMTDATFIELYNPRDIEAVTADMQRYLRLQNNANPDRKMTAIEFEPLLDMSENAYRTRGSIVVGEVEPAQLFSIFFIGVFLLLLACFNYMNISIVSATRRLKEIGIRKVVGGQKNHLVVQFFGENLLLCLIALVVGFTLGQYFLVPGFRSSLPGFNIELDLFANLRLWLFMATIVALTGLGSGAYPAYYIASFQPVTIFRNKVKLSGNSRFTQILLVLQFVFSFILIVYSVGFMQNNNYLRTRDWGYNQEQILVLPLNSPAQFQQLKDAVAQRPNVLAVAGAATHIGRSPERRGIEIVGQRYDVTAFDAGYDYIEATGLRLKMGRSFDRHKPTDKEQAVLVNESFVNLMQWQESIGKYFKQNDKELKVIGVVEDFHYRPFWSKIEPAMLTLAEQSSFRYLVASFESGTGAVTSEDLQEAWQTLFPDLPYTGFFQDTIWGPFDQILSGMDQISAFFSSAVLLLSCMGIFGLVSMNISKRTKEISVRKVLGASVNSIAHLINKPFLILLGIAGALGLPAGYSLTQMMLDAFSPYHKELGMLPLLTAFFVVLVATVVTITSQLRKAVLVNPVDALRSE